MSCAWFKPSDAIHSDPELQHAPVKIVAVTASSLSSEEKVLRESFDAYVRKPYTPRDLFSALDSLFGVNQAKSEKSGSMPGRWRQIHREQWRQLQGADLPALQQNMRMREIGDFAKSLWQFSVDTEFSLLGIRAVALSNAVQCFDVAGVNNVLALIAAMPESFDEC